MEQEKAKNKLFRTSRVGDLQRDESLGKISLRYVRDEQIEQISAHNCW